MIRINLIPAAARAEEAKKDIIIIAAAAGTLAVFILVGFFVSRVMLEKKLEKKLAIAQENLAKFTSIAAQVDELSMTKTKLKRRKDLIVGLIKNRLLYSPFMNDFIALLPEKLWLNSLNTTAIGDDGLAIDLSAKSFTSFAIADWITRLEEAPAFSNVTLGRITTTTSGDHAVFSFTLKMSYRKQ